MKSHRHAHPRGNPGGPKGDPKDRRYSSREQEEAAKKQDRIDKIAYDKRKKEEQNEQGNL